MHGFLNRLGYVLAALAVAYGLYGQMRGGDGTGARRPAVREVTPPPPVYRPPGGYTPGPVVTIEVPDKASSTGTAFAIGNDWWLTARHVADGCDAVGLMTAPRKGIRAKQVILHPQADLALLRVPMQADPLPVETAPLTTGQDGFALGYPKGQPGDVHGRMIGHVRMRSVGRYRIEEPVVAWAEQRRVPDTLPSLGGLSGGPLFDRSGRVVGVMVAASKRRGRFMTTDPASIDWLLADSAVSPHRGGGEPIRAEDFSARGDRLRLEKQVAKVLCQVRQREEAS
jgi:serine protease Do